MKTTLRFLCLLLVAGAGAAAAPVKVDIRPGLWEVTTTPTSNDPQIQAAMSSLQQRLANLSPEQRQQMEQMMKQAGVQMDVGAGGTLRSKVCMTRAMIDRNEFPLQQGNCTQSFTPSPDGKGGHIAFSCSQPRASGAGTFTVASDTSYRAHMQVRNDESPKQVVDMDVTGTWQSASCASVK